MRSSRFAPARSIPTSPKGARFHLDAARCLEHDPTAMTNELHDLSIAELANLIAARKLSPLELVEAGRAIFSC